MLKVALIIIIASVIGGIVFYKLGVCLGNYIAKKQKQRNDMMQNGNKHV